MSLAAIYTTANDEAFQSRCMAAAWKTAQQVTLGTGGYDVSQASKDFALSLLRDQTRVTARQVTMQVLRNATIVTAVAASQAVADTDIEFQVNQIWSDLVSIG